jgi:acyl-CoA thioester hydrolase
VGRPDASAKRPYLVYEEFCPTPTARFSLSLSSTIARRELKLSGMAEAIFKHAYRVIYADCTMGNHVYYARYLHMLEAARGEFFRQAGFPLLPLQECGTAFPVIDLNIAFKGPARYDDLLTIELWITEIKGIRLTFGFRVTHPVGHSLAEGHTSHVCASTDERPKRIPAELIERFQPFVRAQEDAR